MSRARDVSDVLSGLGSNIVLDAGVGVDFDGGVLDDYEEGTWQPLAGDNSTPLNELGWYIKIGNLVHVAADVTLPNPNPSSPGRIYGLPFISRSLGYGSIGYNDANQSLSVRIDGGVLARVDFDDMDASGTTFDMSGVRVQFSITYTTSDLI